MKIKSPDIFKIFSIHFVLLLTNSFPNPAMLSEMVLFSCSSVRLDTDSTLSIIVLIVGCWSTLFNDSKLSVSIVPARDFTSVTKIYERYEKGPKIIRRMTKRVIREAIVFHFKNLTAVM